MWNIPFKRIIIYGIVSNLSKCGNIYKLKNIPNHNYKQSVAKLKVTIYTTTSRFMMNYGCEFASLTNNFNTEKGEFVSFSNFKQTNTMIWQKFRYWWRIYHPSWRGQKPITLVKKTGLNRYGQLFKKFSHGMANRKI